MVRLAPAAEGGLDPAEEWGLELPGRLTGREPERLEPGRWPELGLARGHTLAALSSVRREEEQH